MLNTKRALVVLIASTFLIPACRTEVDDKPAAEVSEAVEITEPESELVAVEVIPDESRIDWVGAKVTGQHDGGFERFSGTVFFDNDVPEKIEFTIDTTSIWSDTERLTGHLKTDDFFDVENHPTAHFESSEITPIDTSEGSNYEITGNLQMRGKTNSVTFPATVDTTGDMISANAEFTIDRQRWDVSFKGKPDDLIRNEVLVKLDLKFPKPDTVVNTPQVEDADKATEVESDGSDELEV